MKLKWTLIAGFAGRADGQIFENIADVSRTAMSAAACVQLLVREA
jgi:hypothetical protein